MNVLQAMVDVIKYVLIILVHINAAVIKDTPQMGKGAKVRCTCPLVKDFLLCPFSVLPATFHSDGLLVFHLLETISTSHLLTVSNINVPTRMPILNLSTIISLKSNRT